MTNLTGYIGLGGDRGVKLGKLGAKARSEATSGNLLVIGRAEWTSEASPKEGGGLEMTRSEWAGCCCCFDQADLRFSIPSLQPSFSPAPPLLQPPLRPHLVVREGNALPDPLALPGIQEAHVVLSRDVLLRVLIGRAVGFLSLELLHPHGGPNHLVVGHHEWIVGLANLKAAWDVKLRTGG